MVVTKAPTHGNTNDPVEDQKHNDRAEQWEEDSVERSDPEQIRMHGEDLFSDWSGLPSLSTRSEQFAPLWGHDGGVVRSSRTATSSLKSMAATRRGASKL